VHAGTAQPKPLPVPNSDFCELAGTLNAEELAVVKQVRARLSGRAVARAEELNIGGLGLQG